MSNVIRLSRPRGVTRSTSACMTEKCVICGADTGIPVEQRIDFRAGYVEGVGQTCPNGCRSKQLETSRSMLRRVIKYIIDRHGMQTAREELFAAANDLMR